MSNGFRMDAPFTEGLPYLSRKEETRAKMRLLERQHQKAAIADIKPKDMDQESLGILDDVRRQIDSWVALGDVSHGDISQNADRANNFKGPRRISQHSTSISSGFISGETSPTINHQ